MPIAIYIKENTAKRIAETKRRERTFFTLLSFLGVLSIIFSAWPYLSWQIVTLPRLSGKIDEIPVPQGQVLSSAQSLVSNVQVVSDPDGFSFFVPTNKEQDYISQETRPSEFFITVPKLNIEKAKVKVDATNFYDHLALFPGSAIPGDVGNSFITGHSVLPQFNDPKNYRTIFTKLDDLEVGDDVYVQLQEKNLHFIVLYSKVVDPHDLSVITPISQNGRNLTLMTCVPPGTSTKRLVVITGLI